VEVEDQRGGLRQGCERAERLDPLFEAVPAERRFDIALREIGPVRQVPSSRGVDSVVASDVVVASDDVSPASPVVAGVGDDVACVPSSEPPQPAKRIVMPTAATAIRRFRTPSSFLTRRPG
jgi:hypothetical protein